MSRSCLSGKRWIQRMLTASSFLLRWLPLPRKRVVRFQQTLHGAIRNGFRPECLQQGYLRIRIPQREYTVNENGYRYRAVFIIPEEAEIVRMVFRFFTKEELSFTQIAQKLDALHIPPPNSGCRQRQKRKPTVLPAGALKEEDKRGWTATDVRYMIANVRYCGSVLCQKTYTDHRNGHKQKVNKGEKPKYLIRNHHRLSFGRIVAGSTGSLEGIHGKV